LKEGFGAAEADAAARALREARVEAERMVLATRAALAADGELLDAAERASIHALLAETEAAALSSDHHAIDDAVKALADGTEAFAGARMNRSIRDALAGRSIEDV
jgi:molecular chaperone HscA